MFMKLFIVHISGSSQLLHQRALRASCNSVTVLAYLNKLMKLQQLQKKKSYKYKAKQCMYNYKYLTWLRNNTWITKHPFYILLCKQVKKLYSNQYFPYIRAQISVL